MTRVWQWNRPVTVREVLEDLQQERSIAYTTVMTVMDNLHQKGWVRREVDGRAYRYTAVSTRAAYSAALMNEAWAQSDNPAAALVAFFGMMSAEQREALRDAMRIVRPNLTDVPTVTGRETPEEPTGVPAGVPDRTSAGESADEPEAGPADEPADERTGGRERERPSGATADEAGEAAADQPGHQAGHRSGHGSREAAEVPADEAGPATGR